MSEEEIDIRVNGLENDSKQLGKFQIQIRNSKRQYYDIRKYLEPYFDKAIENRKKISEIDEEKTFLCDDLIANIVPEG